MIKKMCVALVVVLAACSSVMSPGTPGTPDLRLQVTGELFVRSSATGAASVPFVVQNHGTATVRVPRCGDAVGLEVLKEEGSAWVQHHAAICQTHQNMFPYAVEPGESLQGTWSVREPGRFRIRVVAGCDCEIRIGYPAESEAFEVR
ncbi:MAG: hypothetical protein ICV87_04290 [Gemmatimonadetes bacterium]|nr:hypothetical protein [Gemmatimonadota bacterium]